MFQTKWLAVLFFLVFSAPFFGCKNAFEEFSKKDTDEAIYYEAVRLNSQKDYTNAIKKFEKLSATFLANRNVKADYASAYAGRCGLNLLLLIDAIKAAPNVNLFVTLLKQFTGAVATNINDCKSAETILRSIGDSGSARTTNENLLMAFVSLAKIGAILAFRADTNSDDVPDPTFDSCNTAKLPDSEAREIASAINLILESLTAPGVPSLIGSSLTSVQTACANASIFNVCSSPYQTYPATFSVNQIKGINSIIKTQDYPGLGTCANTITNCVCP